MKPRRRTIPGWLIALLFLLGAGIAIYPMISNYYYDIRANNEIEQFTTGTSEMDRAEIERRIQLAQAYNQTLDPSRIADPYTKKEREGIAEYARMLEVQEMIGYVTIPKIDVHLPIRAGTSDQVLERGAGHLEGTSLPVGGPSTHAVITAHRGLASAIMFRHLDQLAEGDVFYITNIETTLAYQVDQILTVEPSDFSPVLVAKDQDYCTLLTCTPYMINSHRLLVRGHRVEYTPPQDESVLRALRTTMRYRTYFYIAVAVAVLLLLIALRTWLSNRKWRKVHAAPPEDPERTVLGETKEDRQDGS